MSTSGWRLDQSTVAVRAGETLSERQLLEALMLPSANNIAALLAVHNSGSIEAFVEEMNATAANWGCPRPTTPTPAASKKRTVSTARDQVKLARAAMQDPTFAEIVAKPSAALPVAGLVPNYQRTGRPRRLRRDQDRLRPRRRAAACSSPSG